MARYSMTHVLLLLLAVGIVTGLHEFEDVLNADHAEPINEKFFGSLPIFPSSLVKRNPPQILMVYNAERYHNWSEWSECLPKLCIEQRYRRCKDESWNTSFGNPIMTMKCAAKYIVEKRVCRDKTKCAMNAGLQLMSKLKDVCGYRPNDSRSDYNMKIIGGEKSEPHSWPWAVRLSVGSKYGIDAHLCGGTLIAPHWILTAAHCLMFENPRIPIGKMIRLQDYMRYMIIAHTGDHDRKKHESDQSDSVVYQAIIHPQYNRQLKTDGYDIALLYLAKPIKMTDGVGYACQPTSGEVLEPGQKCYAVGWGRVAHEKEPTFNDLHNILQTLLQNFGRGRGRYQRSAISHRRRQRPSSSSVMSNKRNTADELHEVELPIIPNRDCVKYYGFLTDNHVCAGMNGKDTCDGDSGGGFYCQNPGTNQWYIAGITSFGLARGCGTHPGVYTSTISHFDWIASTIAKPPSAEDE